VKSQEAGKLKLDWGLLLLRLDLLLLSQICNVDVLGCLVGFVLMPSYVSPKPLGGFVGHKAVSV
jgi:hypothetical protein